MQGFPSRDPQSKVSTSSRPFLYPSVIHRHRPSTAPAMPSPSPAILSAKSSLHSKERAELVRRTRKLEQLLGVSMQVVVDDPVQFETAPIEPADGAAALPPHPRRRLRSTRRPNAPTLVLPPPSPVVMTPSTGVLISTSTQVYVDPSSSGSCVSPTTPTPSSSFATVFPSLPSPRTNNSLHPPNLIRHKSSTRSFTLYSSPSPTPTRTDTPILHVPSPTRLRSESILTCDSVDFPDKAADDARNNHQNGGSSDDIGAAAQRQRQIHMAHKLQRHLGESIPPELFMRFPPPRSSSLPEEALPDSPKRRKIAHKPSLSLRMISRKKSKAAINVPEVPNEPRQRTLSHRKHTSDDLSIRSNTRMLRGDREGRSTSPETITTANNSKADWVSTLTTIPPDWGKVDPAEMSLRQYESSPGVVVLVEDQRPVPSAMSAKEKKLNVRRALKMANKFGEAPPLALFQITNTTASTSNIDISVVDSASFGVPRSPAASSTWSFHATPVLSSENDLPSGALALPAVVGVGRWGRDSVSSSLIGTRTRRSSISTVSCQSIVVETKETIPEPAPIILTPPPVRAPTSKRSLSITALPLSFTSRRRQATKLTRFFGVEYPDLYQAMVIDELPLPAEKKPYLAEMDLGESLRVDDHDSCRWSVKAPDEIKEVMDRLRELKI